MRPHCLSLHGGQKHAARRATQFDPVTRQHVGIDLTGPTPQLVRLQMPPDAHRSMVSDHVACGGRICDLLWYPDASAIAFVSSSRDHKQAWVRVADARTGTVRTLLEEQAKTQVGEVGIAQNWRVLH